jgi:hypothetical protein
MRPSYFGNLGTGLMKKYGVIFTALVAISSPSVTLSQQNDDLIIVTQTPDGPVIDPTDNPQMKPVEPSQEQADILSALSQVENIGTEIEALVDLVGKAESLNSLDSGVLDRIETEILNWTKPLPASNPEANLAGYLALSNILPENSTYASKRDDYQLRVLELRQSVLKKFKTTTDEFSGVTWYQHKKRPRYMDTRPMVGLYIGKKGNQPPFLRFMLSYTADSWLFVENAQFNIDGDFVDVPPDEWMRDNDSEIWEWIDVVATSSHTELARRIANSKKTIIRFNGRQYFDNYIVKEDDKEVLRDALLAYEVMLEQKG